MAGLRGQWRMRLRPIYFLWSLETVEYFARFLCALGHYRLTNVDVSIARINLTGFWLSSNEMEQETGEIIRWSTGKLLRRGGLAQIKCVPEKFHVACGLPVLCSFFLNLKGRLSQSSQHILVFKSPFCQVEQTLVTKDIYLKYLLLGECFCSRRLKAIYVFLRDFSL